MPRKKKAKNRKGLESRIEQLEKLIAKMKKENPSHRSRDEFVSDSFGKGSTARTLSPEEEARRWPEASAREMSAWSDDDNRAWQMAQALQASTEPISAAAASVPAESDIHTPYPAASVPAESDIHALYPPEIVRQSQGPGYVDMTERPLQVSGRGFEPIVVNRSPAEDDIHAPYPPEVVEMPAESDIYAPYAPEVVHRSAPQAPPGQVVGGAVEDLARAADTSKFRGVDEPGMIGLSPQPSEAGEAARRAYEMAMLKKYIEAFKQASDTTILDQ